jgi:hypothetical protein
MATADQVKALIRSSTDGDDNPGFYAPAKQVAAQVVRSGHGKFALELREIVDQVQARAETAAPVRGPGPISLVQFRGELVAVLEERRGTLPGVAA